jgi:lysozyme
VSAVDLAIPRLKVAEGFRSRVYTDTEGHKTIGYGCNLDAGLTQSAAEALLVAQADELHSAISAYGWYATLDPVRQSVCLEIAFNAGLSGLVSGFPRMIAAIGSQDWTTAAAECHVVNPELASRYAALAQLMLTGSAS